MSQRLVFHLRALRHLEPTWSNQRSIILHTHYRILSTSGLVGGQYLCRQDWHGIRTVRSLRGLQHGFISKSVLLWVRLIDLRPLLPLSWKGHQRELGQLEAFVLPWPGVHWVQWVSPFSPRRHNLPHRRLDLKGWSSR